MGRSTDDESDARARDALALLDAEIAARAEATAEAAGGWPCRAGCDLCCRRLARPPELTRPEWARLRAAINGLPASVQAEVRARAAAMPETGPLTCPLLDEEHGRCRVYEARPIACRTYGFYVRREHDLVCAEVERHAAGRPVVWGNHASIDVRLERLGGAPRSLGAWLQDDERPRPG